LELAQENDHHGVCGGSSIVRRCASAMKSAGLKVVLPVLGDGVEHQPPPTS